MIEKTYHCVGGDGSIDSMMPALGFKEVPVEEANFVLFSGGADIHPALYDAKIHPRTYPNPTRDKYELDAYYRVKDDAFKLGICRGGQLLNALNGGFLYQDVDNHQGNHTVQYYDQSGKVSFHRINSIHHQMMAPTPEAEVWCIAERSTYRDKEASVKAQVDYDKDGPDPEVIYYPKSRSLCFQAHPEYDRTATRDLFVECLRRAVKLAGENIEVTNPDSTKSPWSDYSPGDYQDCAY